MQPTHPSQSDICKRYGVPAQTPSENDRIGIAMNTLHLLPINGMRIPGMSGSSGWFIFGGDQSSGDPNFYSPLCAKHIKQHCEMAIPYLGLPTGWRFQIDPNGHEDVWYDESLLRKPN